jgi:DNA-binding MarR family transcriptional regulator/GNAT superfamily N-acetyltransferase
MTHNVSDAISSIRAFSRFYTQILGLLDEGLLESPYTLTEARVLFELGQREETDLMQLRGDLAIDSGYMTRILAKLQAERLVTTRKDRADGRRVILRLTERGKTAYAMLNQRSAEQIATLLKPLSPAQQGVVVSSMDQIRGLLSNGSSPQPTIRFRDPAPGDLGWVVERHGALYATEYGWDSRFEALVARIVADFAEHHDPVFERCWIAELAGQRVGSVFLVRQSDEVAKLRLLLVEPAARGRGLGRALVRECIRFAREAGYRRIALWTNDVLIEARRIYESEGFRLVDQTPHADFGPPMVAETWELEL